MDTATTQFTDRMGLLFEAEGQPPIAGRIFGYLLLSDDPCSLDQLAGALRVSKASVSTNARMLAEKGMLERVCRPFDRHDYYGVAPDLFNRTMAERMRRWQRLHRDGGWGAENAAHPERAGPRPAAGLREGVRLHGRGHRRGGGALGA